VVGVGLLSTTLWEFDPDAAETGRRITFPNSKLFGSEYSILKNGEKHIWDSVSFSLPLNSDYSKQKDALLQACDEILGAKKMAANAKEQQEQLISNGVSPNTPQQPEVLVSLSGDHLEITLRYLVGSPQKAQIKSEISERVLSLLAKKR